MCRFSQCCCCKLVVGAYIVAGWTIGICGLGVGLTSYGMRLIDIACERFSEYYDGGYRAYDDRIRHHSVMAYCHNNFLYIGLCIQLAVLSLWILSAGGLIAGALKKKRHAYIPWIVVTSIVLGLNALAACYLFYEVVTHIEVVQWVNGYTCLLMSLHVTQIGIWIYSLTVICNHFRQLKQEQFQTPDFVSLTDNIVIEPIESLEKQKEAMSANYM